MILASDHPTVVRLEQALVSVLAQVLEAKRSASPDGRNTAAEALAINDLELAYVRLMDALERGVDSGPLESAASAASWAIWLGLRAHELDVDRRVS